LQIGISGDVGRAAIRGDRFKLRRRRRRIGDDVVVFHTKVGKGGPAKRIDSNRRHVPEYGLERAVIFNLIVKILD
jgi:hypothetical protein